MRPALLLVAHGSRDARFVATAELVCAAVRRELPGVAVELSYLDLALPLVGDALEELAVSTDDVVVVPLLLGDGYHSRFDLPAIIGTTQRRRPSLRVTQTSVVGDDSMVAALTDRLRQAGLASDDGVLLCAVGSSDAGSDAQAQRRGRELSSILDLPVRTVFATKLGAEDCELHCASEQLVAAGARRIVLSPYFLSPGLLTERVTGRLLAARPDTLVAEPIGAHPTLIDAIRRRYVAATAVQLRREPRQKTLRMSLTARSEYGG